MDQANRKSTANSGARPSSLVNKKHSAIEGSDSANDPALSKTADVPGSRPMKRYLRSRQRRPSSQVLPEARSIVFEGITLDDEGWGKLKETLRGIRKVDHWMAGRSDKGDTTLYVSTRWATDKKVVTPIQELLPSKTLPPKTKEKESEFVRKWLENWVTVGESADRYTQRLLRPGRPAIPGLVSGATLPQRSLSSQSLRMGSAQRKSKEMGSAQSKSKETQGASISGVPRSLAATYTGPHPT